MRKNLSNNYIALVINHLVKALPISGDKEKYYVSATTIHHLKRKIGQEAVEEQQEEGLEGLKVDGKTVITIMEHNHSKKTHYSTITSDPGEKYISHFESNQSGLAIAAGVMEAIYDTNSIETIVAIGTGNDIVYL